MTNPVSVNAYGVAIGSAPNVGMIPYITRLDPTPNSLVGPNGPFMIGQNWINTEAGTSFQLVGLSSSSGEVTANWIALNGGGGGGNTIVGTANQISAVTFAGTTTLSFTNGISIGSYQPISPPTGGILMPGQISTGSTITDGLSQVYIDSSTQTYGINLVGTMDIPDGSNNIIGMLGRSSFSALSNIAAFAQYDALPFFSVGPALTANIAACYFGSTNARNNFGTISKMAVFYAAAGAPGAGTITNSYGGYFNTPVAGSNTVALYTDNMVVGDPNGVASANAIAVPLGTCAFKDFTTAPASANAATSTFGSVTLGVSKQNTLTYDIIVNLCLVVTAATAATIQFSLARGIGTPLVTQVPSFSTATTMIFNFSYYLPNNYFLLVTTTGTITVASTTTTATGV